MITNVAKLKAFINTEPRGLVLLHCDHKVDYKLFKVSNDGLQVEPISKRLADTLKEAHVLYPCRYKSIDTRKLDDIIE